MKCKVIVLLLIAVYAIPGFNQELRSRGFAGFQYRDLCESDMDSLELKDARGILLERVVPNSPAEKAGFQAGDVIKKYDDHDILNGSQLNSVIKNYYANDAISVTYLRDGKQKKTSLVLQAFPKETSDEIHIEYTSFVTHDGVRLRAVLTSPLNSEGKKLPALFMTSALIASRLIGLPFFSMTRELAYEVTKNGFRVLRFEQRGFGDSEGEDYRDTDFFLEVDDNIAAFEFLINRSDVDRGKIFVYGHSTEGMVAAIVAQHKETAGLVTSCTIGRTFYERMGETLRLQGIYGGDTAAEIDTTIKDYFLLTVSIAGGDSLKTIVNKYPRLARFLNQNNRIMDDRNEQYWRQQLNLNLSVVYSEITEPVLIIYGTSDYLTQLACHEHIRDVLTSTGNQDVTLAVIENLDHRYAFAKDKQDSYQNYRSRNVEMNPEPVKRIVEWLNAHR